MKKWFILFIILVVVLILIFPIFKDRKVCYFSYGSNMNVEQINSRNFTYSDVFSGYVDDYKLVFNKVSGTQGVGYGNIVPEINSKVEGVTYYTYEDSLINMDAYEGVSSNQYYRTKINVITSKGELLCDVYIANNTKEGLKPTQNYINQLLQGKEYLSDEYYNMLLEIETYN
ncbi:gamma-glutamylcyclotransferase [archaeon]|nr:gamma-glutamylcyclotransferase [archaeon]